MSKSSVNRIGKGCSGCYFNHKVTAEICGGNIVKHKHICTNVIDTVVLANGVKPYEPINNKYRTENKLHPCFRSRF